ncbi:oxidoreductase C-terminal domain-containing protein [Streptomyces anulatus]|uniref:oxidoreductase C-terminal domain-containing protein n=1 Tax=Streptomyces TaxID=1883 RepID=UPI00211D7EAA|nr:oxidoreductase C-terminal domain-containing protein [Streptomyces sp. or20]
MPSFWSDVHGVRLRSVGLPGLGDTVKVHERDRDARRLEVSCHRDGRLIGALAIGRTSRLAAYRRTLAEHSPEGCPVSAPGTPATGARRRTPRPRWRRAWSC